MTAREMSKKELQHSIDVVIKLDETRREEDGRIGVYGADEVLARAQVGALQSIAAAFQVIVEQNDALVQRLDHLNASLVRMEGVMKTRR